MKKNKLSEDLLQYLRAHLISSYKADKANLLNNNLSNLLVSAPVNLDFELFVLATGIALVKNLL